MNFQNLKTPQVKGLILGIIVMILMIGFHLPPGFAVVLGIIFGFVSFFVLNENKTS